MGKKLYGFGALAGMFLLILDGRTALEGAVQGIQLCIQSVIPSLFPFFFLSALMMGAFSGSGWKFLVPVGRWLGIPRGAESILLPAFLGGYPTGAQAVYQAWKDGGLPTTQAERLLAFCNNAGPSFLFGILSREFPGLIYPGLLWLIHFLSAVFTAILIPGDTEARVCIPPNKSNPTGAMESSLRTMALVCGWVILFRVLISFLQKWLFAFLPAFWIPLISGLLELTNGCTLLSCISDIKLRFLVCSVMLSFGGACVTMQTWSVTGDLSKKFYIAGKTLQSLFSCIISYALLSKTYWILLFIAVFPLILGKVRNRYSFSRRCRV